MNHRTPGRDLLGARRLVLLLALLVAALGCASSAPYGRLAAAGGSYSRAIESLAGAAGDLAVDASSARILQDDALANTDLATYRRFAEADRERRRALARLAAHARVLRRYFGLLGDLAAGRGGGATIKALDGVAAALDAAGQALRGGRLAPEGRQARTAATAAAAWYTRRLARREIAARTPLLLRELEAQRGVLEVLDGAIRHDLELLATTREERLVIEPLLAETPIADQERWMADRRAALAADPALAALDDAASASQALAKALAAAAAREPDITTIERLLTEVEGMAAALEGLGVSWKAVP